jgi:hypothetical protein
MQMRTTLSHFGLDHCGIGHSTLLKARGSVHTLFGMRNVCISMMDLRSFAFLMNHGLRSVSGMFKYVKEKHVSNLNIYTIFQSAIPPEGKPLCFLLYADKTKLSSFGTAKGYPIVARCANLPVEIRNGMGFAGGRVVGWLPIVRS